MPREDRPGGQPEFRPVKSAYRALDVLEAVAAGPASLSELSRLLGIPKSSLHGLVRTLTERGWVQAVEGGTRYQLGLRALHVGARFTEEDETVARVAGVLDRLAAETGETVQQARLDGAEVVYVAKRDSPHPVRLISFLGSRLPAHATALGKSLLAARRDTEVRALLPRPLPVLTSSTHRGWTALAADLAAIRARGYAVDEGEAMEGLRCFAVTVPSAGAGPPTDAVSVSVPVFRLDRAREETIVAALLESRSSLG